MSFQWLGMRITEETDRRKREAEIMERLPRALDEFYAVLGLCVEGYQSAFGNEAATIYRGSDKISITVKAYRGGEWQQTGRVEIVSVLSIPGFQVDRGIGGEPLIIEVGLLPGDKLFYRDRNLDEYVNMDELTRRSLDRAFFPKLAA